MGTKYSKVKQDIKSKILDGTFLPHQKINSETELMDKFGVSRHTIRVAVGELVSEGWLYREQGAGTFCADRKTGTRKGERNQRNIAIVTTYISNYIFPSIIKGAESFLSENGFQVSLFSTNNNHNKEKQVLETILSQNFDGVIIEPTKSAFSNPNINYYFNLERLNIPYIMINALYEELDPLCLIMNDEKGGFVQTEHLIKLGHKKLVGFFKTDDIQGNKRMKGYIKAHRAYGVPIDPNYIVTYDSEKSFEKPVEEIKRILEQTEKPTALVCYNDELAIALLDVLREKNLNVPKDISIVGYDDSFLAQASEVKLTTIRHPKEEMGVTAAQMIVQMSTGQQGTNKKDKNELKTIIYEPELIVRNSTMQVNLEVSV
jgi:GntR family transcriptional regulator, arabinose operon transcriptional repressor